MVRDTEAEVPHPVIIACGAFGDTLSLVPLQAEQEVPHEGGIHKSQTSLLSLLVIGQFMTP